MQGDAAAFDTKIQAFKKELGYWESYLSASKFVAGNVFTLADLAFAPQVLFFVRQGASLDEYPKLKAYLADAKVSCIQADLAVDRHGLHTAKGMKGDMQGL